MSIKYLEGGDLATLDGYKFRRDKKTGYYLSSAKIGRSRKRLHIYVWEREHGPVPRGFSVHHLDGDKSNNDIGNLALMTTKAHTKHHADQRVISNYEKMRDNMVNVAGVAAKAWHKSPEGRAWHREHYRRNEGKLHATKQRKCAFCGTTYASAGPNSRYCSNKCKSAARRASGVDNVQKTCERCGAPYTANKYQQTKYCPLCSSKKH